MPSESTILEVPIADVRVSDQFLWSARPVTWVPVTDGFAAGLQASATPDQTVIVRRSAPSPSETAECAAQEETPALEWIAAIAKPEHRWAILLVRGADVLAKRFTDLSGDQLDGAAAEWLADRLNEEAAETAEQLNAERAAGAQEPTPSNSKSVQTLGDRAQEETSR